MLKQAGGRPILIDRYSALLFSEGAQVSDAPERAGAGEFYFYEGESALPDSRQIESVILYLWNREYPADIRFDRGLLAGMKRVGKSDFAGTSHEKITKEVYER